MRALAGPLGRPVGTGAAYGAILLLGLFAFARLPIGLAPDLELPSMTVEARWPNAGPVEVEALVTSRVEAAVESLRGVKEVRSRSAADLCEVDVSFERGIDLDLAEVLLRERLAALRDELPEGVESPRIVNARPRGAEGGSFLVLQASGLLAPEAIREALEETILPRVLSVPGVASAEIYGGAEPEIGIALDRGALERGIASIGAVSAALARVGGTRSLGSVRSGDLSIPVILDREVASAEAVRAARLGEGTDGGGSRVLRIGDVARVSGGWAEPRRMSRVDGKPSVQLVLERGPGTNLLHVASGAKEAIARAAPRLPAGVSIETLYDASERVRGELDVLVRRALISVGCIFVVLLLFHRRFRAPAAVLGSVIFSALATFVLFRAFGLGMNLVTLSGLALAFGMAVDNAIVILENIVVRTRERNNRLRTLAATREVLFPLGAATLTTAVVLVPFLYLSGDLREFYLPFALSVTLSLVASMGVAFTLTPLLARWTFAERRILPGTRFPIAAFLSAPYRRLLAASVRRPLVFALASFVLLAVSVWVFDEHVRRGSFFPQDPDTRLTVMIELPPGGEIAHADAVIRAFESQALEHDFKERGFIEKVETQVLDRRAFMSVRFHPAVNRTTIPEILREEMVVRAAATSGLSVSVQGHGPGYHSGGGNVSPAYQLVLRGPDYPTLAALADRMRERLERNGRIKNVDTNISGGSVRGALLLAARPDRRRLGELGVTMAELAATIHPAIASDLSRRTLRGPDGDLPALVRFAGGDALAPETLARTFHRMPRGAPVPLGEVLEITERPVQAEIRRFNQQYERRVGFEYRGPRKIGDRFIRAITETTDLPAGYTMEEGSGFFFTARDDRATKAAIAGAIVLVYMVSAALFESLVLPFVAILAVPLGFVGIAIAFWATGEPFDRTAYIGLILLAGIAINNALLLVHRAGAILRRTGDAVRAATTAARERARPILMTTATSVAGLLPLAWGGDPEAVAGWRSLALAGTGGLLGSTLFTLAVIPALFVLFTRKNAARWAAAKGA